MLTHLYVERHWCSCLLTVALDTNLAEPKWSTTKLAEYIVIKTKFADNFRSEVCRIMLCISIY